MTLGRKVGKKCDKKIPADPLTKRPPTNGRSGACPHPICYFLYHPCFARCRCIPWLILLILLLIGLYFLCPWLPYLWSLVPSFYCHMGKETFGTWTGASQDYQPGTPGQYSSGQDGNGNSRGQTGYSPGQDQGQGDFRGQGNQGQAQGMRGNLRNDPSQNIYPGQNSGQGPQGQSGSDGNNLGNQNSFSQGPQGQPFSNIRSQGSQNSYPPGQGQNPNENNMRGGGGQGQNPNENNMRGGQDQYSNENNMRGGQGQNPNENNIRGGQYRDPRSPQGPANNLRNNPKKNNYPGQVSQGQGNLRTDPSKSNGPPVNSGQSPGIGNSPSEIFPENLNSDSQINYADCKKGAFIHRVLSFPPFRGYENERGTQFIILQQNPNPDLYWSFNPPGKVQIALSSPIFVTGLTLRHLPIDLHPNRDLGTAPKDFEFYAFNEIPGREGKVLPTFLERFTFTDFLKSKQTFKLKYPLAQKFEFVQLEFLNSQNGGNLVDVYKVEIHGTV